MFEWKRSDLRPPRATSGWLFLCLLLVALGLCARHASSDYAGALPLLRVSPNQRFLLKQSGEPFLWLGDTGWKALYRLTREETDLYLQDRSAKGFTLIQTVVTPIHGSMSLPNRYGHTPLLNNDPRQPNEAFFQHVDYFVSRAESLGLYVGLLPTWGNFVRWGPLNTEAGARAWGEFLGRRYRHKPIVWILGGDDLAGGFEHLWRAMAEGLAVGDSGNHLITYHPPGGNSSSKWFHAQSWMDFNMFQTGHYFDSPYSYNLPTADYALTPVKPTLDGEPGYENIPSFDNRGRLNDWEVRKFAYWSLFAGAFGHTYGAGDVWQFYSSRYPPEFGANTEWRTALEFPGARQMRHVRTLLESRPFLTRVPEQGLIASAVGTGAERKQATRGSDGSYAFVYLPSGGSVTVALSRLSGSTLNAYWYDPRSGAASSAGSFANTAGTRAFNAPGGGAGQDWVLVIDDASRGFSPPGGGSPPPPPAPTTYSISGRVTASGSGLGGVAISTAGASSTTASDGAYTLSGLAAGTYTVTPSMSGYTFSPASQSITLGPSRSGVDFSASGSAPPPQSGFLKGVNLTGNAVTIEGNRWLSFSEAKASGLSVTGGSWAGSYAFPLVPAVDTDTRHVLQTVVWSGGNFSVSQTIPNGTYQVYLWMVENYKDNYRKVDVRMEGGATVAGGIGELPLGYWRKYGPYSVSVADGALSLDIHKQKGDPLLAGFAIFGAGAPPPPPPAPETYSISGRVTENGAGLSGVTVSTSGVSATTAGDGTYTLSGRTAGTYTVTASRSGYSFTPTSQSVTLGPSKTGVNFSAAQNPPPPSAGGFLKGINLNGNAVTIEGNRWLSFSEAKAQGLSVNAAVYSARYGFPLVPNPDADTRHMLESMVWSGGNFSLSQALPNGTYQLYFWAVENYRDNFRSFDLKLEGRTAAANLGELPLGHWRKYGPYPVTVTDGVLNIEVHKRRGDPLLCGLAIHAGG
jgi:hypothetical protein